MLFRVHSVEKSTSSYIQNRALLDTSAHKIFLDSVMILPSPPEIHWSQIQVAKAELDSRCCPVMCFGSLHSHDIADVRA